MASFPVVTEDGRHCPLGWSFFQHRLYLPSVPFKRVILLLTETIVFCAFLYITNAFTHPFLRAAHFIGTPL